MKDITEFKAWFSNEISQYPLIAKSNSLSLNELCYVLRQSGRDFSVGWLTDTGYGTVPSVRNCFIPSRDLKRKIMLTDFYPVEPDDCCDDTFLGDIRVDVIPEQLAFGSSIEKALEDWGHELTEIHTLLGCCELLAGMAEEAAELSQAALKLRRTIDKSNPTPVSTSEASHRLNEEFADVVLCAAALGLDREEVERFIREKAARWSMRLEVDD